ncbi:hypothetical protein FTX61_05130 [Nitriliruptoraceae bacterium ZYF776]|nr:hypothetical protein [Profundirhabdus halotolerans]
MSVSPLALLGGQEHTPGCEPIDRRLLELTGVARPVVGIVPLASSFRTRARTVGRAVGWWRLLGVEVTVAAATEADRQATHDAIARADLLVLTGGVPDRLHARLAGSSVWAHLVARWRAGVPLSGSSSGAMIAAGHRQQVRPPFRVVAGFGLAPDLAVAPHHDTPGARRLADLRVRTHPHLTIVGIDDRTALVHTGRYEVLGAGAVTVRRGRWQRVHRHGEVVDPADLGIVTAAARPRSAARHDTAASHGTAAVAPQAARVGPVATGVVPARTASTNAAARSGPRAAASAARRPAACA